MKFPLTGSDKHRVVILRVGNLLTQEEINDALRVSENTMWWRAVIQIIEEASDELHGNAVAAITTEKSLSAAANLGGREALKNLLLELNYRRDSSTA